MILAIHSYPGGNEAAARHWPYFLNAGADDIIGIGTTDGGCVWPEDCQFVNIGKNEYMNGPNLCHRLLDTLSFLLTTKHDHFCIAEYDVVFFSKIPSFTGVAAHRAGGKTWNSKPSFFIHNPWMIDRKSAMKIIVQGEELIDQCTYGTPESSPDVFLAWVCETAGIRVKFDLLREHTQNCYDIPGSLEAAREAYRKGLNCIHGIKHHHELEFITT